MRIKVFRVVGQARKGLETKSRWHEQSSSPFHRLYIWMLFVTCTPCRHISSIRLQIFHILVTKVIPSHCFGLITNLVLKATSRFAGRRGATDRLLASGWVPPTGPIFVIYWPAPKRLSFLCVCLILLAVSGQDNWIKNCLPFQTALLVRVQHLGGIRDFKQ